MSHTNLPSPTGRGSPLAPPNRFDTVHREADFEQLEPDDELLDDSRKVATEFLPDNSQSIVSENDSPDIPFRFSLNPYRGCEHGCSYCYARPYHEYLGLNAGIDFETKIFVKERAPELFREWLAKFKGEPSPIAFSGVTDCYQPAERRFRLTRRCLEIALEARQPISIVTKNSLITRDLDILTEMARRRIISVAVSLTTLDQALARAMEPRTSIPTARLRTIAELSNSGIPTTVLVAPVIPGLTDFEIPAILRKAKQAGAASAGYVLLRLPLTVRPVFLDWLQRALPAKKSLVESRIRSTRGGDFYQSEFGIRMQGQGVIADQIQRTFELFIRQNGLDGKQAPFDASQFRRPTPASGQQRLFSD